MKNHDDILSELYHMILDKYLRLYTWDMGLQLEILWILSFALSIEGVPKARNMSNRISWIVLRLAASQWITI